MTMKPMRRLLWMLAPLALLASTGCFQGIAESQVRKTLTRLLGPAQHYDVKIEHTSDGMLLDGHVQDLSIQATRVATREGLVIQRFDVEMHNLQLNRDKKSVKSVERAAFDLDILQEDLSNLARRKIHDIHDVQVLISPQAVTVVAPARALNQAVDFSLQGRLSVADGERIDFTPTGVGIGPLTVATGVLKLIMGRINPIADLSKLPIPVTIDALNQEPGVLNVRGRLFQKPTTALLHGKNPGLAIPGPGILR